MTAFAASPLSPAPTKRATSTVVPVAMAPIPAKTTNSTCTEIPTPAIAAAPRRETISRSTTPTAVCRSCSTITGQARLKTRRRMPASSSAAGPTPATLTPAPAEPPGPGPGAGRRSAVFTSAVPRSLAVTLHQAYPGPSAPSCREDRKRDTGRLPAYARGAPRAAAGVRGPAHPPW